MEVNPIVATDTTLYGVRVLFIGDLKRLYEPVRIAAEKATEATANNSKTYLLVCVAYTSSHEIPRAIYESCQERSGGNQVMNGSGLIKVTNLGKHVYMGVAPDPDILLRSSGETRLSNFLLWQTTNCLLYSPKALWPEMGCGRWFMGSWSFRRVLSTWRKRRNRHNEVNLSKSIWY